ncbi:hypothetical protein PDJAM_G00265280 [Pangasius djambal]|nr:hypothetical protein [Pangasius djambal]
MISLSTPACSGTNRAAPFPIWRRRCSPPRLCSCRRCRPRPAPLSPRCCRTS